MRKLALATLLLAGSQWFSPAVMAADTPNCIPSFLEVNKRYYVDTGSSEFRVKVLGIETDSCWISVKEVLPKGASEVHFSKKKTKPFWLNMSTVVSVRKKLDEEVVVATTPSFSHPTAPAAQQ